VSFQSRTRLGAASGAILSSYSETTVDYESTKQVLTALEREGVRYVVFGAAAMNLHGLARFTEDLDLFVAPDHENIDRLKRALRSVFDDHHIEEISADDLQGEYPAIQYVPPAGAFHLDILSRLGDAWRFDDLVAVRIPFEDLTVSVASPDTLYRMKRDTVRLKDKADAELLKERFNLKDER
jgi:hypothetical protein